MQRHTKKCALLPIQIETLIEHSLNKTLFFYYLMEFLEKYTFNLSTTSLN